MPFKKPHHTMDPDGVKQHPQVPGGYLIKPKGLNIVWGNDSRYWTLKDSAAELIQVSWLEVSGLVKNVIKNKTYKVKFEVRVKQDGFGWSNTKVLVMAKVGKRGNYQFKEATLIPDGNVVTIPNDKDLEIKVDANDPDPDLHFGLYEVWSGKWKGGLEIRKAEILPVT